MGPIFGSKLELTAWVSKSKKMKVLNWGMKVKDGFYNPNLLMFVHLQEGYLITFEG